MSERATREPQTDQQIQHDETAAYAMKPEMDFMAAERVVAPRTGALALREGQVTMIPVPDLTVKQQEEHSMRREYAKRDAQAAIKAEEVLIDPQANAQAIIRADQDLKNILSPDRQPRPKSQFSNLIENRR
jgi:hypothetical protein